MLDICGADPDPMQQELARLRNGCWVSDYVSCTAIQIIISLLVQLQVFYRYKFMRLNTTQGIGTYFDLLVQETKVRT